MTGFLDIALAYHAKGHPVIPVRNNKKPYYPGWDKWFTQPQTENEVRQLFSIEAEGIAILLWPASANIVVDFDGPHAKQAWEEHVKIKLPETARNTTQSGGEHHFYRVPAVNCFRLKRKIRLVQASCGCHKACGVDLLVNGYALVPPTPGYVEDSQHLSESAVDLPDEVLNLIGSNSVTKVSEISGSETIPNGQRNSTLTSLAGTMRKRGMSIESIRAALIAENETRCSPPLKQEEIESMLLSASKWDEGVVAEGEHLTDLGNARRLVRLYGGDLRNCPEIGWFWWDGKRWALDRTGQIYRCAKAVCKSIYAEADNCNEISVRDALRDWAHKSEASARIDAIVKLANSEPGIPVAQSEMDTNPLLLNVENGTLNLQTGELRKHSRQDLISKIVPIEYDSYATCPTWEAFINRITANEFELKKFLQMAVGYSLTGLTIEQCFFILYGLGANGKSTFLSVVSTLLGDYARQTRTETLLAKTGNQISNDVARLAGSRFVCAVEADSGRKLDLSFIKQVAGGDRMTARYLNHEFFEFDPTFKLWLSVNHKPKIPDTDDGIWRKARLIPFVVTIPENERDPHLLMKLRTELPGILAWAVEGCLMWRSDGLPVPDIVKEATAGYRVENDLIATFLEECCELVDNFDVSKDEVYQRYTTWCTASGETALTKNELTRRLAEKGIESGRKAKSRFWKGLKLRG